MEQQQLQPWRFLFRGGEENNKNNNEKHQKTNFKSECTSRVFQRFELWVRIAWDKRGCGNRLGEKSVETTETLSWQSEGVAHGEGARTRLRYRISVSHYVREKMACKQFLWVRDKKQTDKHRGGAHNFSFAVFSQRRLIGYSCTPHLPHANMFGNYGRSVAAEGFSTTKKAKSDQCAFPSLPSHFQWAAVSDPREQVWARAAQPQGHDLRGADRSLV